MVEVESNVERTDGVTFVRATVANTRATPQRVRLRSALSGPTWPPRRGGIAAPEWSGDTWEGVVRPDRCRGVGFATPAEPDPSLESPLEVVSTERASADERVERPDEVLATLEEWSPTSDVLSRDL